MFPQNDYHTLEMHRLRVERATALPRQAINDHPSQANYSRLRSGMAWIGRLQKVRVQVTFEVAEPYPEA